MEACDGKPQSWEDLTGHKACHLLQLMWPSGNPRPEPEARLSHSERTADEAVTPISLQMRGTEGDVVCLS